MNEEVEKKLKRERIEACLNSKKFVDCDIIGQFKPCHSPDFVEIKGET